MNTITTAALNEFNNINEPISIDQDSELDAVCDVISDMIIDSFIESRKHLVAKEKIDIDINPKKVEN